MHVPAPCRPELFAAPFAGERLGQVVDGVDVSSHVGCPGKGFVALVTLVLSVLVLGLAKMVKQTLLKSNMKTSERERRSKTFYL